MHRLYLIRDTSAPDGEYTLLHPVTVPLGDGLSVTVPEGFNTDFASIPPAVRWLVSRAGTDVAGLVHDYCYRQGIVRRQVADGLLYALCRDAGVPAWRCTVMMLAVMLVGGKHYRRSTTDGPQQASHGSVT